MNAADERSRDRGVAIVGITTESLATDELAQTLRGYRRDTHVGAWGEAELAETIDRLLAEP